MTDASDDTGLIVPVRLPPPLEELRLRSVADSRFVREAARWSTRTRFALASEAVAPR